MTQSRGLTQSRVKNTIPVLKNLLRNNFHISSIFNGNLPMQVERTIFYVIHPRTCLLLQIKILYGFHIITFLHVRIYKAKKCKSYTMLLRYLQRSLLKQSSRLVVTNFDQDN